MKSLSIALAVKRKAKKQKMQYENDEQLDMADQGAEMEAKSAEHADFLSQDAHNDETIDAAMSKKDRLSNIMDMVRRKHLRR
jgi:hypothetical protein